MFHKVICFHFISIDRNTFWKAGMSSYGHYLGNSSIYIGTVGFSNLAYRQAAGRSKPTLGIGVGTWICLRYTRTLRLLPSSHSCLHPLGVCSLQVAWPTIQFSSPTCAICFDHLSSFWVLLWSSGSVVWAYIKTKICNCENSACGFTDTAFSYSRPGVYCSLYICTLVVKRFGLPLFLLWKLSITAVTSILILPNRQ